MPVCKSSLLISLEHPETKVLSPRDGRPQLKMENGASSEGKDPSAFLSEIIGAPVIVKLNSGVVYKGIFIVGALIVGSQLMNAQVSSNQSMAT